jgi:tetratricopeptide (TPR) repeat protein
VLAVDEYQHNPDELFALALAADETGDVAEAERLYRTVIKGDPKDAAAPFNLGNMLRACGRKAEAEAAFRDATRLDPFFAEAWYNLSDLLDEQGRSEAAIECLRTAPTAETQTVSSVSEITGESAIASRAGNYVAPSSPSYSLCLMPSCCIAMVVCLFFIATSVELLEVCP